MESERLLDASEVAVRISVSRRTVWLWKDAGRIPAPIRVGKLCRWRLSDITRWIEEGCPSCRPAPSGPRSRATRNSASANPLPANSGRS